MWSRGLGVSDGASGEDSPGVLGPSGEGVLIILGAWAEELCVKPPYLCLRTSDCSEGLNPVSLKTDRVF